MTEFIRPSFFSTVYIRLYTFVFSFSHLTNSPSSFQRCFVTLTKNNQTKLQRTIWWHLALKFSLSVCILIINIRSHNSQYYLRIFSDWLKGPLTVPLECLLRYSFDSELPIHPQLTHLYPSPFLFLHFGLSVLSYINPSPLINTRTDLTLQSRSSWYEELFLPKRRDHYSLLSVTKFLSLYLKTVVSIKTTNHMLPKFPFVPLVTRSYSWVCFRHRHSDFSYPT